MAKNRDISHDTAPLILTYQSRQCNDQPGLETLTPYLLTEILVEIRCTVSPRLPSTIHEHVGNCFFFYTYVETFFFLPEKSGYPSYDLKLSFCLLTLFYGFCRSCCGFERPVYLQGSNCTLNLNLTRLKLNTTATCLYHVAVVLSLIFYAVSALH